MKKLLLILITISMMNCSSQNEQDVNGKWYMINKSGFVEFTITNDSLINQKLFPDFTFKNNKKRVVEIKEKVFLKDRILILGENPKDSTEYYTLMTLVQSKDKSYMEYIWNGIDTISSIKTLTKLNESDNRQLLGYNLYTKDYLEALKKKKSIENMTLEDFKKYLEVYSTNMKVATTEYKKNIKGYYGEASTFNFQISLQSLLQIDYNPIQNSNTMNSLFAKYIENEEIKELLKRLKEK